MARLFISCSPNKATFILIIFFFGYPQFSNGVPVEPAAALAADPATASVPVAAPAPAAAVEPAAKVVPPPQQPLGGGIVTEHKNPDGSTITVTRYNGPLPAGAFQSPLSSGLLTGLHDYHHNNLYQTQYFHRQQIEQAQVAAAAMLLQNMQIFNNFPLYRTAPTYLVPSPYVYSSGPFFSPFYGFGYPFGGGYPAYGQPVKSV